MLNQQHPYIQRREFRRRTEVHKENQRKILECKQNLAALVKMAQEFQETQELPLTPRNS